MIRQKHYYGLNHLYFLTRSTSKLRHSDVTGSTTMVTDQAGTVDWDMNFYPWGKAWRQAGSTYWHVFGGMGFENINNVSPTPNRDYAEALGRWLSPDPMGGDITNPQSLNRYAYVLNNPASLNDPLGLQPPQALLHQEYQEWRLSCGKTPICMYMWGQNPFFALDYLQTGEGYYDLGGGEFGWSNGFSNLAALAGYVYYANPSFGGVLDTAANLGPPPPQPGTKGTAACIAGGLQSMFGGTVTPGNPVGEVGGHWNFNFTLQFSSRAEATSFASAYTSASGGWPPPARFGTRPSIHLENLANWSFVGGVYSIPATAHIDLFNPNSGPGGLLGHIGTDLVWGHVDQFFGGNIDPNGCAWGGGD